MDRWGRECLQFSLLDRLSCRWLKRRIWCRILFWSKDYLFRASENVNSHACWIEQSEDGRTLLLGGVAVPEKVHRRFIKSFVAEFGDVVMEIFVGNHEGSFILVPYVIAEIWEQRRAVGNKSGQDWGRNLLRVGLVVERWHLCNERACSDTNCRIVREYR